ncbi:dynamin family protein [Nostoc sphaeroides CHAB 2801]|uniref:dynamin family protein n=1 Tax=Nostoc sphaeroides TaxID=446679 RepID=UPI001E2FF27D|nr:dynamin family protein [Nostoc sphaeroides]MCC5631923.1 dynamin family protein [Nostoc sphaeroides CHAB 2801]
MLEILVPLLPEIASDVLKGLISIGLEKLSQQILNPTPEEPGSREEIPIQDAEIIAKIEEILKNRDDIIDKIKNDKNEMTQIIQQVLNEVKILSQRDPDLKVASGQIIISQLQPGEDKELNPTYLTGKLERIEKRLDEIAAIRRTELKTGTPQITDNTPPSTSPQTPQSKQPGTQKKNPDSPASVEPQKSKILEFPMLEKLHKHKEYGEDVLRGLKLLEPYQSSANEILDNCQLKDCLKSLKDAANKTVELTSSPVKIAIMGEFSSGKTLLIGSLIGYADALPISEIPTTGNVTAIHLHQQEGFKTTEFDDFIVEYLSEPEVQQCLDFMLDQAKQRAKASELPPFPQATSKTLNEDTLNSYKKWCESAWNQTKNPKLRSLLRELIVFIRAYVNYGADLCGEKGESLKISHTTARDGLKLTNMLPVNQELKFEDIPSFAKQAVNKKRPSSELLQNSFSLIRRVNINVKISKEIWNLGTTQDTAKFILLDFPGLGAAESGVRDTFVSLQELAEVQTILILLNGSRPGSDSAHEIFNMIQQKRPQQNLKDFILVGVGRFNQLSIEREQKLDQLINSPAKNPLTETNVYQEFSGLKTIIDQASALTSQKDRIVLLDQLISLADLAKLSSAVKVGTEEFLGKLGDQNDSSLQESKRMRDKWENLSKRLLATDPHSSLGKQLGYFAVEGGIGKLRELILSHVAEHSLKQLYEDTDSTAKELYEQQNQLKEILSNLGISSEESSALKKLRDAIEKIYTTDNRFKDNLGKQPLKDARGLAISDVIKDEVTYKILEWSQWNLLFSRAQDGIIVLPSKRDDDDDSPFRPRKKPLDNIPTKSDDFYEVFDKTVKELETFASERIKEAIINLLQQLSEQLSSEIKYLNEILNEEIETDIENKFDDEQVDIFRKFYDGYNPKKWEDYVIKQTFKRNQPIEAETVFPLARASKDEKHEMGQIFDWAPEYSKNNSQKANQVLLVQRLRDEITASISLHIIEYVSQINKKVDKAILKALNSLTPDLNALLKKEALLRYIAGEKQENNKANPVSPILSQIASISSHHISN